jgi:ribosomal protein L21
LEDLRGEKIRVSKFKSKVRYRRTTGFRAALTKVEIQQIGIAKAKVEVKVVKPVVKKVAVKKTVAKK